MGTKIIKRIVQVPNSELMQKDLISITLSFHKSVTKELLLECASQLVKAKQIIDKPDQMGINFSIGIIAALIKYIPYKGEN